MRRSGCRGLWSRHVDTGDCDDGIRSGQENILPPDPAVSAHRVLPSEAPIGIFQGARTPRLSYLDFLMKITFNCSHCLLQFMRINSFHVGRYQHEAQARNDGGVYQQSPREFLVMSMTARFFFILQMLPCSGRLMPIRNTSYIIAI